MSQPYRLFGADLSPYSMKVRQVLQFKQLTFEWVPRSLANQSEFVRYAKLPLIPVLVGADDESMQDSTPLVEALERRHPEPAITPDDPALAFLSELLEDYADEWLNKAMFHYRWTFEADQLSAGRRLADMLLEGSPPAEDRAGLEASIRERMTSRLHYVGSNAETAPIIEGSFIRLLDILQAHLEGRPYLFGGRPALADFGIAGQLCQLAGDPTPGEIAQARAPRVLAWLARMEAATVEGPFETLATLEPTLTPLLQEEVAGCYLPWAAANAAASASGDLVSVDLPGGVFEQSPQRYAAKAFMEVRRKRAMLADDPDLARLLGETGCDVFLEAPARPDPVVETDDEESAESPLTIESDVDDESEAAVAVGPEDDDGEVQSGEEREQ